MKPTFDKIFFCTGARNHDLLKRFHQHEIKFEYDERMASFKALGLSKVSKLPIAVCTTSGTAVAQCVPAMLEAYYSELPLVLISGDRPKKLHGTGSPQTIDHEPLTRSCRRTYLEIDLSELPHLDLTDVQYPVHINVLVDDTVPHEMGLKFHQDFSGFKNFVSMVKKPLFIFSHENESMRDFVEKFSKTKLSFYCETLSSARDLTDIKTEKKLISLFNNNTFDSIIRIGQTPLTKIWRLLEKKPIPVFHFDSRNLPALSFGEVLPLSSKELLSSEEFWNIIGTLLPFPYVDETPWKLEELTQKYPDSEISYFSKLNHLLPSKSHVYLGNSLVIRFFELTQKKQFSVYGNRGVNGIDGQLASAIGVAMGVKEDVYCILGDVTTFYDLSSLREMPENLHLIIMNNGGGRIFDMLNLDKRIVMEHEKNFQDLSKGMGVSYSQKITDIGKAQVIELFPDQSQTEMFLSEWNK